MNELEFGEALGMNMEGSETSGKGDIGQNGEKSHVQPRETERYYYEQISECLK